MRIDSRAGDARRVSVFAIALLCALGTARSDEPDRLVQLDGTVTGGQVVRIQDVPGEGARVHLGGAAAAPVDLFALRRIERTVAARQPTPAAVVHLVGEGQIHARQVALSDGRFRIGWAGDAGVPPWELPIELVRAVHFSAGKSEQTAKLSGYDNFARVRDSTEGREDQLFVITPELIQAVPGVLEGIADTQLTFRWADRARQVDLGKVLGVVLAAPAQPPDRSGQCLARLADGSALAGRLVRLEGGQLVLAPAKGIETKLPWSAVVRLEVRSDRVAFCSELEPVRVVETPGLTGRWSWRRDASVSGNPLKLGELTYERGLGVHADSRLEFAAGARHELFVATIGIDAETGGKGDCLFRVLGDGQELFQQRMKGSDKPVEVRLPITGVKTLSLIVEQGEDWDLADHADWCDARLVRNAKPAP